MRTQLAGLKQHSHEDYQLLQGQCPQLPSSFPLGNGLLSSSSASKHAHSEHQASGTGPQGTNQTTSSIVGSSWEY